MIPLSKWQTSYATAPHGHAHCVHPISNAPVPGMHPPHPFLVPAAPWLWCKHPRTSLLLQLLAAGAEPSRAAGSLPASTQLLGEPVPRQCREPSTWPTRAGSPHTSPPPFASTSNILVCPGASAPCFAITSSLHAQP